MPTGSNRIEQAKAVIASCKTERGFHASADLYPELWMRDLVFSEDVLLRLGNADTVRTHFEAFLAKQRKNGQIPTVVTTPLRRIVNQPFHFWTSDAEVLLLIGTRKYANSTQDFEFLHRHEEQLERCLHFVEARLTDSGFIPGCDWRDAMMNYENKILLANQILLLEMYGLIGRTEESQRLKGNIREAFYSQEDGFFADFLWNNAGISKKELRFDCFGNALAVLNDGLLPGDSMGVISAFSRNKTKYGYRNLFPPYAIKRLEALTSIRRINAFVRNGAVLRNWPNNYQNSGIWPFVESRIVRALLKLGQGGEARQLFEIMANRDGFNEWYSPLTGEPKGSRQQLWTAAALIDANDALSLGS